MIIIYWRCFGMTETDERFLRSTLEELAQHLKDDPIKLYTKVRRLEDEPELSKKISERINKLNDQSYTFSDCAAEVSYVLTATERLLIYCHPDSNIAKASRREMDSAKWGITWGSFSAAYPPKDQLKSKSTIWHETVHLLLRRKDDSDECYESYPPYPKKADCNCDTCIMQYEPNEKWGGEWSLCDKIIGFLQDLAKDV